MDLDSLYSGWGPKTDLAWVKLDNDGTVGGASLSVLTIWPMRSACRLMPGNVGLTA